MNEGIENDEHVVALKFIKDITSKCDEVQDTILAEILSQNAEVEYLKRHGIDKGCIDKESFKSKVPLVIYEDLKPDIQRIVNGDLSPILCSRPTSLLFSSSGTSGGEPRLIPVTDEELPRRIKLYNLLTPVITKFIQGLDSGKSLWFLFTREESKTPSGITVGGALPFYIKTLFDEKRPYNPYNVFTSPKESVLCPHYDQSIYTQLLCGLYQRHEVVRLGAAFASTFVAVIRFLRHHYLELCQDISSMKLNLKITDPSLRAHMVEHVMKQVDPELSEFIKHACNEENWQGILQKIWPNTKYQVEDVVSPTGFYNSTPQFKFLRRKNVVLSIHVDKTTEFELQKAMEMVSTMLQPFGTSVVDYTSYANVETIPGHYAIYCELSNSEVTTVKIMEQCCLAIEDSLSYAYRYFRVHDRSIGPLQIQVVKNGTFEKLRAYAISRGACFGQYKVPRCVKQKPVIKLLNSGVVSTHTSPFLPKCNYGE